MIVVCASHIHQNRASLAALFCAVVFLFFQQHLSRWLDKWPNNINDDKKTGSHAAQCSFPSGRICNQYGLSNLIGLLNWYPIDELSWWTDLHILHIFENCRVFTFFHYHLQSCTFSVWNILSFWSNLTISVHSSSILFPKELLFPWWLTEPPPPLFCSSSAPRCVSSWAPCRRVVSKHNTTLLIATFPHKKWWQSQRVHEKKMKAYGTKCSHLLSLIAH